jgi:hypothetical protein
MALVCGLNRAECEADYPVSGAEVKNMLHFTFATPCGFMHDALSTKTNLPLLKNKRTETERRGCVISIPGSYLGGFDAETGFPI